jgi:hypothetical protein
VKCAGPVLGAVAEIVYVLLIAAAVIGALAAVALVAFIAYRLRHGRLRRSVTGAARALPPVQAAQALPPPQPRAIERGGELHLHLHGVTPEEVAAIIERHRPDG